MKRWDDLQLLKLIDELEESEPGMLINGLTLMDRARPLGERDPQNDPQHLAHELLSAGAAGLLEWTQSNTGQNYDPVRESHLWLQQIGGFALTIQGRDRARGRVVLTPLPDPDQDDGRMISGSTLELIARDLGDTYMLHQLPRFFVESGVPEEFVPKQWSGDKWQFCLNLLGDLTEGGARRRILREFIGAWLSDRLLESPSETARKRVVERLNREGWHVEDGVLVIGERTSSDPSATTPRFRDARVASLHPQVRQVAESFLESGHHAVAIFAAFKEINSRVKDLTGLDLDGTKLMGEAMRDRDPLIQFGDLTTQTGRDVQSGLRSIFMGVVSGIRNPDAHEQFRSLSEEEAFEELSLASMLMRRLDQARGSAQAP